MKTIANLIEENPEHEALIKEAIDVYKEQSYYVRQRICAFCDKVLTQEEQDAISQNSFNYTCFKHKELDRYFIIDKIRKELGIPPRTPFYELKIYDQLNK